MPLHTMPLHTMALHRMPLRAGRTISAGLLVALLMLGGCGGGGGGGTPVALVTVNVSGAIQYQRLTLTAGSGLDLPLLVRPARFVDVIVRAAGAGAVYGTASTASDGTYALSVDAPAGQLLEVVPFSKTDLDPTRQITVHNALPPATNSHSPLDAFSQASTPFPTAANVVSNVTVLYPVGAPVGTPRPAIGFATLDVLTTCYDTALAAPGMSLGPLHCYTALGNNGSPFSGTYYSPVVNAINLFGGAAGNLDGSDTDYFDDPVIAHEFGHFVEFQAAHEMNPVGSHFPEYVLMPAFSFSEGQSTGFGCLCLGSPFYVDSIGTAGGLGLDLNVESVVTVPTHATGIGAEWAIAEILWDLVDGASGPADTDGDLVSVPLSELYQALDTVDPASDAPYIGLLLTRLLGLSATLTNADLTTLLGGTPENQNISWPLAGDDVWPTAISNGVVENGSVDSTSGLCTALAGSEWYQFTIASPMTVTLVLNVTPNPGSDNLDLFLHNNADAFVPLALSTNGGLTETIGPQLLPAGTYIVKVVASCGGGNVSTYTLTPTIN